MSALRGDFLDDEQKSWFGARMSESHTGRVIVPSYLYVKFKKIVGDEHLKNEHIKIWLIDNVYND